MGEAAEPRIEWARLQHAVANSDFTFVDADDGVCVTEIVIDEREFLIGRSVACDFHLPLATISNRHCLIYTTCEVHSSSDVEFKENQCFNAFVRDLNSSNGTYVNGERIKSQVAVPLSTGDIICLGSTRNSETAPLLRFNTLPFQAAPSYIESFMTYKCKKASPKRKKPRQSEGARGVDANEQLQKSYKNLRKELDEVCNQLQAAKEDADQKSFKVQNQELQISELEKRLEEKKILEEENKHLNAEKDKLVAALAKEAELLTISNAQSKNANEQFTKEIAHAKAEIKSMEGRLEAMSKKVDEKSALAETYSTEIQKRERQLELEKNRNSQLADTILQKAKSLERLEADFKALKNEALTKEAKIKTLQDQLAKAKEESQLIQEQLNAKQKEDTSRSTIQEKASEEVVKLKQQLQVTNTRQEIEEKRRKFELTEALNDKQVVLTKLSWVRNGVADMIRSRKAILKHLDELNARMDAINERINRDEVFNEKSSQMNSQMTQNSNGKKRSLHDTSDYEDNNSEAESTQQQPGSQKKRKRERETKGELTMPGIPEESQEEAGSVGGAAEDNDKPENETDGGEETGESDNELLNTVVLRPE